MNIRQKYELKLLSDDGFVDMQKIADMFSINLRTVRYDIRILDEYLSHEIGNECISVGNKVASVEERVQKQLSEVVEMNITDFYADRLGSEERMLLILFDLCWSNQYSTIQELADKYFVSRATVNKDIIAVKDYCREHGIRLISQRGKGLYVEADEIERRGHLAKVIRDFTALKLMDEGSVSAAYSQWFVDKELEQIKEIVMDVENTFNTYLADYAYEALVIHIALSMERFRTGTQYGELPEMSEMKKDSIQYQMAYEIIQRINEGFGIELPEAEIYYVALHIGAKSSAAIKREAESDLSLEYYCIKIISLVGKELSYDFSNDNRLFESLLQHINVCAYRKKCGLVLENPLKDNLIHTYPELYQIISKVVLSEMQSDYIIQSDDELAYILLHFATAIHRHEENVNRRVDVVVVCATGMGTAELVTTGLGRHYCLNIKGTVAAHQLEKFLKEQEVDMIISTVPLQIKRSYVRVSPLLKREDVVRIGKQMLDMGFDIEKPAIPHSDWSNTARWIEQLLRAYPGKEQEELLKKELQKIPENKIKKKGEQYMLSELLREQGVRLDVECKDWRDAVRKSGEPLLATGDITEAYIEAVIDNVEKSGPYIVVTKGIALPHATNKVGVNSTAMSFVRLSTPVEFGSEANDPVKYLFMLATTDANSHLGALQDLVEFLDRPEFMNVLEAAEKPADVVAYIVSNESEM